MEESKGNGNGNGLHVAEKSVEEALPQAGQATAAGRSVLRRAWHVMGTALSVFLLVLPRRGRPVRNKAPHEMHELAYLDGLRGYLAIIIFNGHVVPRWWGWVPHQILAIPWTQFFFRGNPVALITFFWISGFAITFKISGLMQSGQSDRLLDALTQSVFRRYLRLFLPVLPVTFFAMVTYHFGIAVSDRNPMTIGDNPLWFWIKDTVHFLNPMTPIRWNFDGRCGSQLVEPTWSLNAELRSSMIVFLFCLGTWKLSTTHRKRLACCCVPAFVMWQRQWVGMAFLGLLFAELRHERKRAQNGLSAPAPVATDEEKSQQAEPQAAPTLTSAWVSWIRHLPRREVFLWAMFLYSFTLATDPFESHNKTYFPHNLINAIIPHDWDLVMVMYVHISIATVMMLYCLENLPILQKPLLTTFSRFLGELSFGIYAVHFPIRWIFWDERYIKWQISRYGEGATNMFWVIFPGWIALFVAVLWGADCFRMLDWQVVRLLKHLEDRFFQKHG